MKSAALAEYLEVIGPRTDLDADTERRLVADMTAIRGELAPTPRQKRQAERGREALVRSQMHLVASIAARFEPTTGCDLGDMIQEGNLALIAALDKFDNDRGYRLSSYVTFVVFDHLGKVARATS